MHCCPWPSWTNMLFFTPLCAGWPELNAYFEEFPQRNFEDIWHLTKVRIRTILNFFSALPMRPSHTEQSQSFKLWQNDGKSKCRSPSALSAVGLENVWMNTLAKEKYGQMNTIASDKYCQVNTLAEDNCDHMNTLGEDKYGQEYIWMLVVEGGYSFTWAIPEVLFPLALGEKGRSDLLGAITISWTSQWCL